MDKNNLTPEESLLLISRTIEETKHRFQQNGHILILWGCITFSVFSFSIFFHSWDGTRNLILYGPLAYFRLGPFILSSILEK